MLRLAVVSEAGRPVLQLVADMAQVVGALADGSVVGGVRAAGSNVILAADIPQVGVHGRHQV